MSLDTSPAWRLAEQPVGESWLIEELWAAQAVGIVGGEPKCCKSFLALEMAVAVASGRPCLRRFAVRAPGPVLLYAAEDALHVVRQRLDGICRASGIQLTDVDIQVITAPTLRLDQADDRRRLAETVARHEPRMLVLDPFVRLHRIDENASGEVAPILAYLRDLQRAHQLAVAVVHHARKGAAKLRGGQALRGSSEFHAWGDSNLYLTRQGPLLALAIEHRAARSTERLPLHLDTDGLALALVVGAPPTAVAAAPPPSDTPLDRICHALADAAAPLALAELRTRCHMRTAILCNSLRELAGQGTIRKTPAGYVLEA